MPGGFGYLEIESGCDAKIDENDWAHVEPGNNLKNPCKAADLAGMIGTTVFLPVFDCTVDEQPLTPDVPSDCDDYDPTTTNNAGSGSNTWYHVAGYAKFYLTGAKLSGGTFSSVYPSSTKECPSPNRCLTGWFLDGELHDKPVAEPLAGGTGFGAYVIQPAG